MAVEHFSHCQRELLAATIPIGNTKSAVGNPGSLHLIYDEHLVIRDHHDDA